jgi:hypothetical protein
MEGKKEESDYVWFGEVSARNVDEQTECRWTAPAADVQAAQLELWCGRSEVLHEVLLLQQQREKGTDQQSRQAKNARDSQSCIRNNDVHVHQM